VHRICEHSALLQRTGETARTGAAEQTAFDGLQDTRDTRTSGLKPPPRKRVWVRTPHRAHIYEDEKECLARSAVGRSKGLMRTECARLSTVSWLEVQYLVEAGAGVSASMPGSRLSRTPSSDFSAGFRDQTRGRRSPEHSEVHLDIVRATPTHRSAGSGVFDRDDEPGQSRG
jgi:hypothetical protein